MIMNFKWNSHCFFEELKSLGIDIPRPVFSLSESRANRSNWWFTDISKRLSMNVQWPVPPLSESRTNRSNWWFAKISKRFSMNVQWSVLSLSENRANRSNWWFAEISKRLLMNVWWPVFSLSENKVNKSNWWFVKISKRFSNDFRPVFSLKMNKTAFIFDFRPLKVKIYFMFFDPSGLSKRVWKWRFINNVFFKSFWPTRPPKTRLREW